MTPEKRKRIIDKHRDSLKRNGYHPHTLYWSSREIQQLRFEILSRIGTQNGDSVLDVGCGFGDLFAYFQARDIHTRYLGLDLSTDILQKAEELYPQARFFNGDLFDLSPAEQSYDYVMLSGALNEEMNDEGNYAKSIIKRMYQSCRKGLAFNLLSCRDEVTARRWDLQSFDADEILAFCCGLGAQCELIDDYIDNDFTILMRRIA